jgi:glutathione S-transferase
VVILTALLNLHDTNGEMMRVQLYAFGPALGLPDLSPFCTKAITYLKMTEIPADILIGDPRKSPKGKMPFMDLNGEFISDTRFMVQRLQEHFPEQALPTPQGQKRVLATALQSLLEEHLYFLLLYFRWQNDEGWKIYKKEIESVLKNAGVPSIVAPILSPRLRKGVLKSLFMQGTGRHSETELLDIAEEHFEALSLQLGDNDYLLGEQPHCLDASAWAMLAHVALVPFSSPLKERLKVHSNLIRYCEHIQERFFS